MQVMRHMVMDFLNIASKGEPKNYKFMSTGFNHIDEKSDILTSEKTYIADRVANVTVKGRKTEFPFSTDVYTNQQVIMYIRDLLRNQKNGDDCITSYIRTDVALDNSGEPLAPCAPAREFRVSVIVDSETGGGGEPLSLSGKLVQRGDFADGFLNLTTYEFIPKELFNG